MVYMTYQQEFLCGRFLIARQRVVNSHTKSNSHTYSSSLQDAMVMAKVSRQIGMDSTCSYRFPRR
jgi:hypothetical protein